MNVSGAASTPPQIPQELVAIEEQIQSLQASVNPSIPEERIQPIISRISQLALSSLVAAAHMRSALHTNSIAFVACILAAQKDQVGNRVGEDSFGEVIKKLGTTAIGKQSLLKVAQAVLSEIAVQRSVVLPGSAPSMTELHQATVLLVSQPLFTELREAGILTQNTRVLKS